MITWHRKINRPVATGLLYQSVSLAPFALLRLDMPGQLPFNGRALLKPGRLQQQSR